MNIRMLTGTSRIAKTLYRYPELYDPYQFFDRKIAPVSDPFLYDPEKRCIDGDHAVMLRPGPGGDYILQ